jgi:hypothetical protein
VCWSISSALHGAPLMASGCVAGPVETSTGVDGTEDVADAGADVVVCPPPDEIGGEL